MGGSSGGSAGGGGGSSGKVDFPTYMKEVHKELLASQGDNPMSNYNVFGDGVSVMDAIDTAFGNSPFSGVDAYDPDVPIAANQARYDTLDGIVAGLDEYADWLRMLRQAKESIVDDDEDEFTWEQGANKALKFVDKKLFPQKYIDEVVEAYDCDRQQNLANARSRFAAGMADINCVMSSAFVIGLQLLEDLHSREVDKFASELRLKAHQDRLQFVRDSSPDIRDYANKRWTNILQAIIQMIKLQENKTQGHLSSSQLQAEINRMKIVAKKEQYDRDSELDEADAIWDMEIFQYGGNVLGAIGGGTAVYKSKNKTEKPSTLQSIGAALTAYSIGTKLGINPLNDFLGGL